MITNSDILNEDEFADFIAAQYDLNRITSDRLKDLKPIEYLGLKFSQENRIIPFSLENNKVCVAISDSNALEKLNTIELMTNKKVETFVVTTSELNKLMDDLLSNGINPVGNIEDKEISIDAVNSEVINFVNKLLIDGINSGASDIHLEPFKNKILIRQRIDGSLQLRQYDSQFLFKNYKAIAARFKIISTLDISERRLPQDGGFNLKNAGNNIYFRISVLPTCFGERIVLRILRQDIGSRTIDSIGFSFQDLINFKESISRPQGMVLVTGPTGSGKTTTLYSSINHIKSEGTSILTVEDPVECYIEGVSQVALNENIGLSFSEILKSFLRQDPEALLIGEIRDKKTVDIAIKASLTGHLVLSTLHTNDAPSTIVRLRNMEVPNYLIAASLNCIVAQRLAKKICEHCKSEDKSFTEKIKNLCNAFNERGIVGSFVGVGCDNCNGTGIQGRQAIYEVLTLNSEIKEIIINDGSKLEICEVAESYGFKSIAEEGMGLLKDGLITIDEYCKVLLLN